MPSVLRVWIYHKRPDGTAGDLAYFGIFESLLHVRRFAQNRRFTVDKFVGRSEAVSHEQGIVDRSKLQKVAVAV